MHPSFKRIVAFWGREALKASADTAEDEAVGAVAVEALFEPKWGSLGLFNRSFRCC